MFKFILHVFRGDSSISYMYDIEKFHGLGMWVTFLKKKTLWPLFMDGVQLPQGYSHFEVAVYFLPLSSQKYLVLILLTPERWKTESTLESPTGFKHVTPGLGIQRLNH